MGVQSASKKWTMPAQDGGLTLSQLTIFFTGGLDGEFDLRSDRRDVSILTLY